MVIRFKGMPLMADVLRKQVNRLIADMGGAEGFMEDGVHHTAFTIKQHFYVQPNGDLYVDDDYDEEVTGMLLQGLRAHHHLVEDAEIIVPRKLKEPAEHLPIFLRDDDDDDDDENIARFEDYLPDTAFDDGHFEEEMEEIARGDWDDEE